MQRGFVSFLANFATKQAVLPLSALCGRRKVRTTKGAALPNGKAAGKKLQADRECHRKLYRLVCCCCGFVPLQGATG